MIYKFLVILAISPFVGYAVVGVIENYHKAKNEKGLKRVFALGIIGFIVAILLGWLQ